MPLLHPASPFVTHVQDILDPNGETGPKCSKYKQNIYLQLLN